MWSLVAVATAGHPLNPAHPKSFKTPVPRAVHIQTMSRTMCLSWVVHGCSMLFTNQFVTFTVTCLGNSIRSCRSSLPFQVLFIRKP